MIGQYDCFTEDERSEEIYFIDPYQKFFFSMLDSGCEFRLGFADFINEETFRHDAQTLSYPYSVSSTRSGITGARAYSGRFLRKSRALPMNVANHLPSSQTHSNSLVLAVS
jgi:hypothetical protein